MLLADLRVCPEASEDIAFRCACANGHTEIVKILLADPRISPQADNDDAIRMSSCGGHADVVQLLLADPRVTPQANDDFAIRFACCDPGGVEVVKLLLADPRVSPQARENLSIQNAASRGHTEIVKILLADPRVSPQAITDYGEIKEAHLSCYGLLFLDDRINRVFPQYFVFSSGLEILLPEVNRFIFGFMILLRQSELISSEEVEAEIAEN